MRQCSKPGCSKAAVATLTYNYQDSTAVLGPLSTSAEPHAFDLCDHHAGSLTVPRGWEVVRLQTEFEPAPPSPDDLVALVEAIREAAGRSDDSQGVDEDPFGAGTSPRGHGGSPATNGSDNYAPLRRRSHFTVVTGDAEPKGTSAPEPPAKGVFGQDE